MSDWKTLDEILPEMGRAVEADPENWREQFEYINDYGEAFSLTGFSLNQAFKYRRKPRTMKYTVERPMSLLEPPEKGSKLWVADPTIGEWASEVIWFNGETDYLWLNRGLIYATKEEAVAAAKAMVGGE